MRLDHNQFGNFRHATEHDGSRSGPCEWRWAPSIDKKSKLSRYERPIPHHLGDTGRSALRPGRKKYAPPLTVVKAGSPVIFLRIGRLGIL